MLNIKKPKKSKFGNPPKIGEPKTSNLSKKDSKTLVPFNFKVEPEFKREVKMYAASKDRTMIDVIRAAFNEYKSKNI